MNKETETGQGVVDDDKSTVSEISEEIMGESSVAEQRKSLKLNLNDDEAGDNDDEPTTSSSSSSTDTQILLLSSRNKKVDEELSQEVNVPLTPSNPAPVLDDKTKSREILAAKLEKSLLDKFIDDAIEIHEKKTSKMLTDQYKQAVVFGLDQDERDTDEDEDDDDDVNNLDSSPNPFKIHIPSIDLSEDDDDELIKTGVKAPPKPPPIVYNVPINNEKVSNLTGSLVDNYFWPRLDNLKEHLIRLDDEEIQNLPELVDFFKSDLENPNNDAKEAEATFKRMLFDMVGELLYDLYLEKYELPQAISSYLPNAKRSLKKAYFRSALRGPLQKETAKKMIINKVHFLF